MKNNCGTMTEQNTMYFHPDHLGSLSYVTDKKGNFFEMIEYLPYGETLYDEAATVDKTEFRFTSKEQDSETGLYYYGARYYDARTSRWISTDPPLATGEYLPVAPISKEAKHHNENLPGGGVFNTVNLDAYHYGANNPIIFLDLDGLTDIIFIDKDRNKNDAILYKQAVKYQSPKNTFTVVGHGSPEGMRKENYISRFTPKELAKIIVNHENFKSGMIVKLISCRTGVKSDIDDKIYAQEVAQEIANLTGKEAKVEAPNNICWLPWGGEPYVAPRDKENPSKPDFENEGKFVVFTAKPEKSKEENNK